MDNPVFGNCGPDTPHTQNVSSNQQTHSIHPHHLSMNYQSAGRFSTIQYPIDNKSDTSLNTQISGYDKSYLIPSEDNYSEDDLPIWDDKQNPSPPHHFMEDIGGYDQKLQDSQSFIKQIEEQQMQNQYNQAPLQNHQIQNQYDPTSLQNHQIQNQYNPTPMQNQKITQNQYNLTQLQNQQRRSQYNPVPLQNQQMQNQYNPTSLQNQQMQNQYNPLQFKNQQMAQEYPSVNPINSDVTRLPYNINISQPSQISAQIPQPNQNYLGNSLNQRPPLNFDNVGLFALFVCFCFNPLFGFAAYIIAAIGQDVEYTNYEKARGMKIASYAVSIFGILIGIIIAIVVGVLMTRRY